MKPLRMLRSVRSQIQAAAKAAGRRECVGLLARKPAEELVTAMVRLPAQAGWATAVAEPLAVRHAADRLAADGLLPAGLWHSHATFEVFHSATDQETLGRLMPAMATWGYQRATPRFMAPSVVGADLAVLPGQDGMGWVFALEGEAIPGSPDHLRTAWAEVITRFGPVEYPHQPRLEEDTLVLAGKEVAVVLRLPPKGKLVVRREDVSLYKIAWLHSLVVNLRNHECVECVAVHNCGGRIVLDQQPAALELVDDPVDPGEGSPVEPINGDGLLSSPEESLVPIRWAGVRL